LTMLFMLISYVEIWLKKKPTWFNPHNHTYICISHKFRSNISTNYFVVNVRCCADSRIFVKISILKWEKLCNFGLTWELYLKVLSLQRSGYSRTPCQTELVVGQWDL
jgi:hypothetical protein